MRKTLPVILCALCLLGCASERHISEFRVSSSKTKASASSKVAAEKLAQVFPGLYWYASDACLRETTRHGFGHPQKHDEFVNSIKAVIEKFEEVESRGIRLGTIRLRLHDPEVPEEYWVLELTREGNTWAPKAGAKYMDGELAFDLFKDEYFAGIKIMGSMKPYFQKALTAYSEGKDFSAVFTKSRQFPAQETSANVRADQLVGRWRHVDAERKLATNIAFEPDGTYVGSVEENGKANGSFSGKWTLKDGILNYEYTASSDDRIPVGAKDQDKIIMLTKDRYTIQNAAGLRETYIRME